MKKILIAFLVAISIFAFVSCDHDVSGANAGNGNQPTTGIAAVSATAGRTECGWVQLWKDGPKWATMNVGAELASYEGVTTYDTQYVGGLYAWGGTNDAKTMSPYTQDVNTGTTDLTGTSDTATNLWGSNWKMPTKKDFYNLINKDEENKSLKTTLTTWTWCDGTTTQYVSGCTLKGWKVSGVNAYANNSIFLPAAGYYDTVAHQSEVIYLFSSTYEYANDQNQAYIFNANSVIKMVTLSPNENSNIKSLSVRAVLAE